MVCCEFIQMALITSLSSMNYYKEKRIFSIAGVNAKNTGITTVFTTENGTQNFYPTAVYIESTAASSIATPISVCVGTNAASYNNIMAVSAATGLITSGLHMPLPLSVVTAVVPANTAIVANITIAAVGTSQTITIHVEGFYAP